MIYWCVSLIWLLDPKNLDIIKTLKLRYLWNIVKVSTYYYAMKTNVDLI